MKFKRLSVATVLGFLLGFGLSISGNGQTLSSVHVKTSSLDGISLAPYDPAAYLPFTNYLQSHPTQASLSPFSCILENRSGKNVVGLTLRWTWTDTAGHERTLYYRTDSLFLNQRAIVVDGGTLLVTPDFLLPKSLLSSGMIMPGREMMSRDAAELAKASNVTVDLDTIIFEDGLVAGPDLSQTLSKIQARREAAIQLATTVIEMLKNGQDPSVMLAQAAKPTQPVTIDNWVAIWRARIARLLQHGNPQLTAQTLLTLPNLKFRRE